MEERYAKCFDLFPKQTQLDIRMLIPNKHDKVDTIVLACVFVKNGVLKKFLIDNLNDSTDRVVKQVTDNKGSAKTLPEFIDIKLSDECAILLDNVLSFKERYSDKMTQDVLTTYLSYVMLKHHKLLCHAFFKNCVDKRKYETIISSFENSLYEFVDTKVSDKLEEYGEYLYTPLTLTTYKCSSRDKEVQECVNILSRMNKSNVILVGNAGVGKTSIVYGICNIIQSPDCPQSLRGMIIYSLDVTKLISGTTYRGDLERRVDALISELKSCPNIILFIDEIHTLFTKPSGEDQASSIQSMLKPYLTSGAKIIGCTTNTEYKTIESDKAFERRFSVVRVGEMSADTTFNTVMNKIQEYENYHNLTVPEDMCRYLIEVSDTYVKDRYFPDKAFDVLDIGCVICKNNKEDVLQKEHINTAIENITSINPNNKSVAFVSESCADIKKLIIGQDAAVDSVCNAFKKYYLGINNKHKPIGNYLLIGPTGTGKTELCVQLASHFFARDCFIRYDMSEFMESHSVSKLIGSPPGYVGFNRTETLTEFVKHNPFSIILFDEIEKAHKDVINVLLQIMDCGRLTDANGQTVDFCNCLVVMTSNIGCRQYMEQSSIGFNQETRDKSIITKYVKDFFSPEFRNRLDDIILFNPICGDTFRKIFNTRLDETLNSYTACGVIVDIDKKAKDKLAELCYDEINGVRNIQRNISGTIDGFVMNAAENNKHTVKITYKDKFVAKTS